jgi:hypothetical protein
MPNRIVVTAALALAATIGTGTVALATTLIGPAGTVGTDAAVSLERPLTAPATRPAASTTAFDPRAVALLAFAARMAGATTGAGTASGSPTGATIAATADPRGTGPASDHTEPSATPSEPVADPSTTTTTNAPPFDCSGSDDGLSETVKQARETYCHGGSDD